MRRTPLAAMLTILAILATTVVMAGCGDKSGSSSSSESKTSTTTTHKHKSKPAY